MPRPAPNPAAECQPDDGTSTRTDAPNRNTTRRDKPNLEIPPSRLREDGYLALSGSDRTNLAATRPDRPDQTGNPASTFP